MATPRPARASAEGASYDMYRWNRHGRRDGAPRPGRAAGCVPQATRAVQVALDRRDNGGDSAAASDQ
jgi:hypothetical protein